MPNSKATEKRSRHLRSSSKFPFPSLNCISWTQTETNLIFRLYFSVNCPFPYKAIDEANSGIRKLEEEYAKICEAASLFEVHVPEPKALKMCRKELRYAKQLWDYIYIVESSIEGLTQAQCSKKRCRMLNFIILPFQIGLQAPGRRLTWKIWIWSWSAWRRKSRRSTRKSRYGRYSSSSSQQ